MRIASSEMLRKIDSYCIKELGIQELVLMENAALKVLNNVDLQNNNNFVVVCGVGNNGGDGFALARHLIANNKDVKVFLVGSVHKLSSSAKVNYEILKKMFIEIEIIEEAQHITNFIDALKKSNITIDALFGTGITREVTGIYNLVIESLNIYSSYIISIDVPSGLNSDTGEIMGISVLSKKTITFQMYKVGFLQYNVHKYLGEVIVEEIGIPQFVIEKYADSSYIANKHMIQKKLIKRNKFAHKGDFGRVTIFAGSKGYSGAAFLCSEAAVKSGAGLVTLCCPEDILSIVNCKLAEVMTASLSDKEKINMLINRSDAIAFGSGMGNNKETGEVLEKIINISKCPIVIDADGLNVLSNNIDILNNRRGSVVITPHPGEMSRLTKLTVEYINNNRIKVARNFAKEYGVVVLLKGYNTIVTDGETTIVNSTGNSAMASGGMGDCLTGIISALMGGGMDAFSAAFCGAYLHGYSGDKLSEKMFCVNASEIINTIPYAIKELFK